MLHIAYAVVEAFYALLCAYEMESCLSNYVGSYINALQIPILINKYESQRRMEIVIMQYSMQTIEGKPVICHN